MQKYHFFLILSILFNVAASFTLKAYATNNSQTFFDLLKNIYFYVAILFFGINFIFYSLSLQAINISSAYPIIVGGSIVLITILSYAFLSEHIFSIQLAGISLIIIGVVMVFSKM